MTVNQDAIKNPIKVLKQMHEFDSDIVNENIEISDSDSDGMVKHLKPSESTKSKVKKRKRRKKKGHKNQDIIASLETHGNKIVKLIEKSKLHNSKYPDAKSSKQVSSNSRATSPDRKMSSAAGTMRVVHEKLSEMSSDPELR